jgi:hypothetical protein
MKLTKLDKNAYWWKGTRTTWWYQDEDDVVWIIKDRDPKKKADMKIPNKRLKEKSSPHSVRFYLAICLSSAIGVLLAFLIARLLLL